MWHWIKHWRDWAMRDLWPIYRMAARPQSFHFSYEKGGLLIADQPIPWNAEVVLVEALVRLRPVHPRRKNDFTLRLPNGQTVSAESLRQQTTEDRARVSFRFAPPAETATAELLWHDATSLGRITLPVLSCDEFLQNLRMQLPTLSVRIGEQNVACQTFVSTQCRGIMASAVLNSPTSLVPLLDLGLHVEFRSERGGAVHTVPARLCSSQLADRQALVTVMPRGFPRRIGTWVATWTVADRLGLHP